MGKKHLSENVSLEENASTKFESHNFPSKFNIYKFSKDEVLELESLMTLVMEENSFKVTKERKI